MSKSSGGDLLEEFLKWGQRVRERIPIDIRTELELGPKYTKQGAWINFFSNKIIGQVMIWDSGEYEYSIESIVDGTVLTYHYGEEIDPSQFEQLFSPITQKFILDG